MELSRRLGNGFLTGVVALCALAATPLAAQQAGGTPRTKIDVSKLGPQVGQTVPDFSLSDQTGKVWTRASIMGPKGALLLFYRSADWCPYQSCDDKVCFNPVSVPLTWTMSLKALVTERARQRQP